MPLRFTPFRAALHLRLPPAPDCTRPQRRFFHETPARRDDIDSKNHYETLNLQTNASPADIKKYYICLTTLPPLCPPPINPLYRGSSQRSNRDQPTGPSTRSRKPTTPTTIARTRTQADASCVSVKRTRY